MQRFTAAKELKTINKNAKTSSVRIIVGSTNPAELQTVLHAFEKWHPPVSTIVVPKKISSSDAITALLACCEELGEVTPQEFAIAIGFSENLLAVRFYKHGCYFDYVTAKKDLSEACTTAFNCLGNIEFHHDLGRQFDTVILFGTFDLFHELHKQLLDAAMMVGKEVVVYINDDQVKFKRDIAGKALPDSKTTMVDSVDKRRANVAAYLRLKGKVRIKQGKHLVQLANTVKLYRAQGKSVALFGGNDQFENFPKLLDFCYAEKLPIITKPRGETDVLLCTTDLKAKMQNHKIAQRYTLDLDHLNSVFFKKRLDNKAAAINYIMSLMQPVKSQNENNLVLGLKEPEVWQYYSLDKSAKRLTQGYAHPGKILLCLPGRSACDVARAKKILHTIHEQLVPLPLRKAVTCFIACYKQEEKTTETNLKSLTANPLGFFSDDAMLFAQLLIFPRISDKVIITKTQASWKIESTPPYTKKSVQELQILLNSITIWARSYGSVIAIEMENAFRFFMQALGYTEREITEAGKAICVLSISNLAPLERPRLFTTVSVTGFNDQQAAKYMAGFQDLVKKYYRPEEPLSQNFISATHNAVLVNVPEQFTELATGRIIRDPKRHYTPNYDSERKCEPGEASINNACPTLIHNELERMLQRMEVYNLNQSQEFKLSGHFFS